ncbi:hypothetical protein LEMLEM_LOCUS22430 [Lemmus lemmus]
MYNLMNQARLKLFRARDDFIADLLNETKTETQQGGKRYNSISSSAERTDDAGSRGSLVWCKCQ